MESPPIKNKAIIFSSSTNTFCNIKHCHLERISTLGILVESLQQDVCSFVLICICIYLYLYLQEYILLHLALPPRATAACFATEDISNFSLQPNCPNDGLMSLISTESKLITMSVLPNTMRTTTEAYAPLAKASL